MAYFNAVRLCDTTGSPISHSSISDKLIVSSSPYLVDLAISGRTTEHAYTILGATNTLDNVWSDFWPLSPNDTFQFPTATSIHSLVSSNANDSTSGTGARSVYIKYLDANHVVQSETVTLNGTTAVNTTNVMLHVLFAYVTATGTNNAPVGNISIKHNTLNQVVEYIAAGYNNSQSVRGTIEKDHSVILTGINVSVGGATPGFYTHLELLATVSPNQVVVPNVWFAKFRSILQDNAHHFTFDVPIVLPAYTDWKVRILSENNASATAVCAIGGIKLGT